LADPVDYFYDESFIFARKLLRNFTAQEWQILKAALPRQSAKFKERLAYILDGEAGESANEIVQILKN